MSPKTPPEKPTGRAIVDKDGKNTWAWQEGFDTARIKALGEELSLSDGSDAKPPETMNPYDRGPAALPDKAGKDHAGKGDVSKAAGGKTTADAAAKQRTLDDMRQLSEKIKRSKHWTRDS